MAQIGKGMKYDTIGLERQRDMGIHDGTERDNQYTNCSRQRRLIICIDIMYKYRSVTLVKTDDRGVY